jgi:hypothetical protein
VLQTADAVTVRDELHAIPTIIKLARQFGQLPLPLGEPVTRDPAPGTSEQLPALSPS